MLWAVLIVLGTLAYAFDVFVSPADNHWSDWFWLAVCVILCAEALARVQRRWVRHRRVLSRSERRREQGLCFRCEYDLRGCTSVKCPECGAFLGTRKYAKPLDL